MPGQYDHRSAAGSANKTYSDTKLPGNPLTDAINRDVGFDIELSVARIAATVFESNKTVRA